jgi:hypothetical protein
MVTKTIKIRLNRQNWGVFLEFAPLDRIVPAQALRAKQRFTPAIFAFIGIFD